MKPGIDYIGITICFYCNDGKGNFLMHKRSKNSRDEHGAWDMGGGQVEFGETLEQTVLREIKEEYGCEGIIQGQIPAHSVFRTLNGIKTHWLAIPFFVLVDPKIAKNNYPKKIEQIGWFRLDNLPSPLHTGFKFALDTFPEYFAKYK